MLFSKTTCQRLEVFYYSSILSSFLEGKECFQIAGKIGQALIQFPHLAEQGPPSRKITCSKILSIDVLLITGLQWQLHSALSSTDLIHKPSCNLVRSYVSLYWRPIPSYTDAFEKAQHKASVSNCGYMIWWFKEITKDGLFVTIEHLQGKAGATLFSYYTTLLCKSIKDKNTAATMTFQDIL